MCDIALPYDATRFARFDVCYHMTQNCRMNGSMENA